MSLACSATATLAEVSSENESLAPNVDAWFREGYSICVTLKEARNLRAFDRETQSSDPFAKLRLLLPGDRSPTIAEHRTRTLHNSLNPMFEERLLCPLASVKANCYFELKLYDADWLRNESMGQVKFTLGHLLQPLVSIKDSNMFWAALASKSNKPQSKANGEALLEVRVLTPEMADEVKAAQECYKQEEALAARFQDSRLKLHLYGLSFAGPLKPEAISRIVKRLIVEIRVGQSMVKHQVMNTQLGTDEDAPLSLVLDDTVTIPLTFAFRPRTGKELASTWPNSFSKLTKGALDVKILLRTEGVLLSKTQVPLWSVPIGNATAVASGMVANTPSRRALAHTSSSMLSRSRSDFNNDMGSVVAKEEGALENALQAFVRTMEPMARRSQFAASCLQFSLSITNKAETSSASQTYSEIKEDVWELDMLEEQEDERDAPPLKDLPPPLEHVCLKMGFEFGPCRLYKLLLAAAPKISLKMAQLEGLSNVYRGPWEMVDTEEGRFRQRKVTYRKPLSVPVPFSPKECNVTEIYTIKVKEIAGWVCEVVNTTDAPMADSFRVLAQIVGTRGSTPGSSLLRVSMKVEFLKNPGMLKSVIENQTVNESAAHWKQMSKIIKEVFEEQDTWGESEDASKSMHRTSSVAAAPIVQVPVPQAPRAIPWQLGLLLVVLLLLGLLVLSIQQHASAVRGLAASIQGLAAAHVQQQCSSGGSMQTLQ